MGPKNVATLNGTKMPQENNAATFLSSQQWQHFPYAHYWWTWTDLNHVVFCITQQIFLVTENNSTQNFMSSSNFYVLGSGEECRNTVGGYHCVCKNGFVKDELTQGRYCIDVNECDLDQCPRHSECINSQGSYYCRCHRGYTKQNGKKKLKLRLFTIIMPIK